MIKKIMGLLLAFILVLSLSGCSKAKKETKTNKKEITKKVVICSGTSEEEGYDMKESFSIEFEKNQASKTTFEFTYIIPEDDKEMIEAFKAIDFENQAGKLFSGFGLDEEKINIKAEKISDKEFKMSISGQYLDLVDLFASEEDKEVYQKTDYENVYKYSIKPAAEENDLKCITKEA